MNYDLSFVTSTGSDLENIISLIESMKNTLSSSNNNLMNNWKGISYNKYNGLNETLSNRYQQKIDELNSVIGLLGLIKRHNELRQQRSEIQRKIASLRPHLYYTETNDEGEEITIYNEKVGKEINALERRIVEINKEMDQLIGQINGITGG